MLHVSRHSPYPATESLTVPQYFGARRRARVEGHAVAHLSALELELVAAREGGAPPVAAGEDLIAPRPCLRARRSVGCSEREVAGGEGRRGRPYTTAPACIPAALSLRWAARRRREACRP